MTQREERPRLDAMDLVSGDAKGNASGLELLELELELELEFGRRAE
jgi:hypothetical protein